VKRQGEGLVVKGTSRDCRLEWTTDGRVVVIPMALPEQRDDYLVRLAVLDVATGNNLGSVPEAHSWSWALDPTDKTLVCENARAVELWRVEPVERVATLEGVRTPVFLRDGKTLATLDGGGDRQAAAVLWDATRGSRSKRIYLETTRDVSWIGAMSDGKSLLFKVTVANNVDEVRLLDVERSHVETVLIDNFNEGLLASRGNTLVLKSWRREGGSSNPWNIHVWDLPPRQPMRTMLGVSAIAATVAIGCLGLIGVARALPRFVHAPSRGVQILVGVLNMFIGAVMLFVAAFLLDSTDVYDLVDLEGPHIPFMRADAHGGLILNVLLIASGFGLLIGQSWGRTLVVLTSLLKLFRVLIVNPILGITVCRSDVNGFILLTGAAIGAVYPLVLLAIFFRRSARPPGDLKAGGPEHSL
jgi:hypothetical protein